MEAIKKQLKRLLHEASTLKSLPGFEGSVNKWIKNKLDKIEDIKVITSTNGTLYAIKGTPKIAIITHIDKVGFLVKRKISDNHSELIPLGNIKMQTGQLLQIWSKKPQYGILSIEKDLPNKEYYLEHYGADSDVIEPGTPVGIVSHPTIFQKEFVIDTWLDNKIGFLLSLILIESCTDLGVIFARKEELSQSTGASVLSKINGIELAINLDTTWDNAPLDKSCVKVDQGVSICLKDDLIPNSELVNWIKGLADKHKISYQTEILEKGESDLTLVNSSAQDIKGLFIGIPLRFMHSANELISINDATETNRLLTLIIQNYKELKHE